jgi:hypothetical protein
MLQIVTMAIMLLQGPKVAAAPPSITIFWSPATVPTGAPAVISVNIYRGTVSGGEGTVPLNPAPIPIANLTCPPSLPSVLQCYKDTAVTPGQPYYYMVTSLNPKESLRSAEASATIPAPTSADAIGSVTSVQN